MPPFGPVRAASIGGLLFGTLVLVVGILVFLSNQHIINITFDFWTFCSLALIFLGIVIIGGVLWARAMFRGRWRRWMDWDHEGEMRGPPPQP